MSEMWRIFAAIDLPSEVREQVKQTQQLLIDAGWKCRWVPESRMHLTVRFYGDLDPDKVSQLQDELRTQLAQQSAFELRVSGLGAFPNPNRPRVIWLGVDDPSERLSALRQLVDTASATIGIEPEQGRYRPHLTVGRLSHRFSVRQDEAVTAFKRFGAYEPLYFLTDHINLVRSESGTGGVRYRILERFPLAEPGHG